MAFSCQDILLLIPFWTNICANNVFSLRAPLWSVEWIQAGDFLLCPKKGRLINPYKSKSVKIEMKERYLTLNQNCENPDLQNAWQFNLLEAKFQFQISKVALVKQTQSPKTAIKCNQGLFHKLTCISNCFICYKDTCKEWIISWLS